ncbi:MAG: ATP-dependent DNA ligase, partial [Erythrobacter sp.]
MQHFAALFTALDQTIKTNAKVAALASYFQVAAEDDKLWTIALLSGRRPKRTLPVSKLREWAAEVAGIPQWLFEDSYPIVGDLAETIALILPEPSSRSMKSLTGWIEDIKALGREEEHIRKKEILAAWDALNRTERFVFNKL